MLLFAAALVLAGCGTEAAESSPSAPVEAAESLQPAPTESVNIDGVQDAAEGSPLALAVVDRLNSIRENDLYEDTQLVRESVRAYFLIKADWLYDREWAEFDFDYFFDTASPEYASLTDDVAAARSLVERYEENGVTKAWTNTTVEFSLVKVDGDTASVECHCIVDSVDAAEPYVLSSESTDYTIELQKVGGVWLFESISTPDGAY